jgi:hypothetical protein
VKHGARRDANQKINNAYSAMHWNESVTHDGILAARRSQSHREPIVIKANIGDRQQEKARVCRRAFLGWWNEAAKNEPAGMIASASKCPRTGQSETSFYGDYFADRRV